MRTAIIYDCEFLTAQGALKNSWWGLEDPDPLVVQIGAVKIGLDDKALPIQDTWQRFIKPVDRHNQQVPLDPYFVDLTGITQQQVDEQGVSLEDALNEMAGFVGNDMCWAWGKDEFYACAVSCYAVGITPPIPMNQFDNARKILALAGMPREDLVTTNSGKLASYFGVADPIREHNAIDDAKSITRALQHLSQENRLNPDWLTKPLTSLNYPTN
ncbi:Exonuclease [Seminavis robusta]|uniref:Exonuclease n=1 Tax=Seminavis robusta TaxID=568900 RepID=A0A9N8DK85_9STRA|nr:Exonuclease [Seminavis robusta]|eukprot:Sro126_g060480.1 Exonuclease (214) ;mRNA; r:20374-21015